VAGWGGSAFAKLGVLTIDLIKATEDVSLGVFLGSFP
jgi:hypothetical protein